MKARFALLFAIVAAPVIFFAMSRAICLVALPVALGVAAWAVSPVTWPAWLVRGLARAVPAAILLALALFLWTR